jgi:hypothetical protein
MGFRGKGGKFSYIDQWTDSMSEGTYRITCIIQAPTPNDSIISLI